MSWLGISNQKHERSDALKYLLRTLTYLVHGLAPPSVAGESTDQANSSSQTSLSDTNSGKRC